MNGTLDMETRKHTAFKTFAELIEAGRGGYSPTLIGSDATLLANAFDLAMMVDKAKARAWRGVRRVA